MFKKQILKRQKIFLLFSTIMAKSKIKNLKISSEVHDVLKNYCNNKGIKIYRFLEKIILEKCKEKKDIYGED